MSDPLIGLIAKRFIQRRDVFAVQTQDGGYMPAREGRDGPYFSLKGRFIEAHLQGKRTLGHYLLDPENNCRLFAFDIDLEKNSTDEAGNVTHQGYWVQTPDLETWTGPEDEWWKARIVHEFDAREAWRDRSHPSRTFTKTQLRMISSMLARTIKDVLDIPVAVAYTGAKGLHVYGFTGSMPAEHVREAAQIVLDSLDCFEPARGKHFFRHKDQSPEDGYPNISIEVFPKQTTINADGGFGNLMRLPLGRNLKAPNDPTFFVDMRAPMSELRPHTDVAALLESGNPWAD